MWPLVSYFLFSKSCIRVPCQLVSKKNIMTSSTSSRSFGPRVGNLQIGPHDLPYPTPNFFIHTQSGSIPHLTPDVFQMSFDPAGTDDHRVPPLQISMESTFTFHENVHPSGLNISQFVGLPFLYYRLTEFAYPTAISIINRHKLVNFLVRDWMDLGSFDLPIMIIAYTSYRKLYGLTSHWLCIRDVNGQAATRLELGKNCGEEASCRRNTKYKCSSFLTVHDPLTKHAMGYNANAGISIWPRTGRVTLDTKKFLEIVSNFQPNMVQCLSDFDVDQMTSFKRLKKSTSRTISYLEDVLDKSLNMNVKVVATIEAGWFLVDKLEGNRTIATILERSDRLAGFFINGVDKLDRVGTNFATLSEILTNLPNEKQIIIPGAFQLDQILELVLQGVDLFDSSVVTKMTEEGNAFGFSLNEFLKTKKEPVAKVINEDLPVSSNDNSATTNKADQKETIISLKDKRFFDDCRPILAECDCYTCRKHTRSYVHHLFSTGELLGIVLLMTHNLFHFDRFFRAIRFCLDDVEKLNLLKKRVATQNSATSVDIEVSHAKSGLKRGQLHL